MLGGGSRLAGGPRRLGPGRQKRLAASRPKNSRASLQLLKLGVNAEFSANAASQAPPRKAQMTHSGGVVRRGAPGLRKPPDPH
jgi:hypothetical protein